MKTTLALILLLISSCIVAQNEVDVSAYQTQYQLPIYEKKSTIVVDGNIDEPAWQLADRATNFWMKFPRDDYHPASQTYAMACYDDKNIYFAIRVQDKKPYVGASLKRDSRIRENDGVSIVLDPINKKTNGYYFSVTAYNVQAEGIVGSADDDIVFSWEAKWYSAVQQTDSFYTVEAMIPLKNIRYDVNNKVWGVNFIRSHKKANEFHTWTRIPVNFRGTNIGYLGGMIWDKAPKSNGSNILLLPYINQSMDRSKVNNTPTKGKLDAGVDAKIAVTNSMNLDLTVNPDFSQVEVDRQVTNLSRFSIFFPERRNFFLENIDLFDRYGTEPIKPFYSRTIGLTPNGQRVPILAGARLTGNLDAKTRLGVLTMQTRATSNYAAQNYSAISVNRQMLKRSIWSGYMLNREGFYTGDNPLEKAIDKYGRNAGTEFSYSNENGNINAWGGWHTSIKPTIKDKNNYILYGAEYSGRNFGALVELNHVGVNYYTDMGFVERIASYYGNTDSLVRAGFNLGYNELRYNIIPKNKKSKVAQHQLKLETVYVQTQQNVFNEYGTEFSYRMNFRNSSAWQIRAENNIVQLTLPTAFTDGIPLPVGRYKYSQYGLTYDSDTRKNFVYGGGITLGGFYNGNYQRIVAKAAYRIQPFFTLELNAEYNNIELPAPYTSDKLFLIAPRIEVNFANNLFWTTFVQYNTQANNVNINSRIQWRYKPASDAYLVYTDNYFTDPLFKNKSRAVVLKVSYWLNL